ncbi:MAG: PEGA domain-containing protein, partial [Candidatus Omnitrophica bacterium]|nr:PEGA domain-containing protein [Candidatus Omnitrophota bacterium]
RAKEYLGLIHQEFAENAIFENIHKNTMSEVSVLRLSESTPGRMESVGGDFSHKIYGKLRGFAMSEFPTIKVIDRTPNPKTSEELATLYREKMAMLPEERRKLALRVGSDFAIHGEVLRYNVVTDQVYSETEIPYSYRKSVNNPEYEEIKRRYDDLTVDLRAARNDREKKAILENIQEERKRLSVTPREIEKLQDSLARYTIISTRRTTRISLVLKLLRIDAENIKLDTLDKEEIDESCDDEKQEVKLASDKVAGAIIPNEPRSKPYTYGTDEEAKMYLENKVVDNVTKGIWKLLKHAYLNTYFERAMAPEATPETKAENFACFVFLSNFLDPEGKRKQAEKVTHACDFLKNFLRENTLSQLNVSVKTEPAEADVFLLNEGKTFIGKTPFVWKCGAGEYTLVFEKPGYEKKTMKVRLSREKNAVQEVLIPRKVLFIVATEPSGAALYLNDDQDALGNTGSLDRPAEFSLPIGKYRLTLKKSGYQTINDELNLSEDKPLVRSYLLKQEEPSKSGDLTEVRRPGNIFVSTEPAQASVYFNGTFKGVTPCHIQEILANRCVIKIEAPGYRSETRIVDLTSGETWLHVELKELQQGGGAQTTN